MDSFKGAFKNEILKIKRKKKLTSFIILSLIITIIYAIVASTLNHYAGINFTGGGEFSVVVLNLFLYVIIPLYISFTAIDMFSGEYSNNTMKTTLLTPANRMTIFKAKTFALVCFICFMLAFVMVISFIASIIIGKTSFNIIYIFVSYIVSIIPLFSVGLFAIIIANLIKSGGGAFMIYIIALLFLAFISLILPITSSFIFTSGLDLYVLFKAPLMSFGKIIRVLSVQAGYIILMFIGGYKLFNSKEI